MADYYIRTVVQPAIPLDAMTALERSLLCEIFEHETEEAGLYVYSSDGTNDMPTLTVEEVRDALIADGERYSESRAAVIVRALLAEASADQDEIMIDITVSGWEIIFQDIVRRWEALDHVVAISSYTCSRMRPDGFGGLAIVITADAIRSKDTNDLIADMLMENGSSPQAA